MKGGGADEAAEGEGPSRPQIIGTSASSSVGASTADRSRAAVFGQRVRFPRAAAVQQFDESSAKNGSRSFPVYLARFCTRARFDCDRQM